jgi:hypothetical protein
MVFAALLGIIYGLIAHGEFTLRYVFEAGFLLGMLAIVAGVIIMFLPSVLFTKVGNTLDQFTNIQ